MQKSVLAEIIRSLNRKEIREVQKWLASPAHNQRQDVPRLFDFMTKKLADPEAGFEKEDAWKYVFPGEAYDDAYMRQVMYFLQKAVEEYIAFSEISKDEIYIQTLLVRFYLSRQLEKPFRLTLEAARKKQEHSPIRNSVYMRERHLLEQEQYYYLVSQKWSADLHLQETSNALDMAYIADKLRIVCHMMSHRAVYQKVTYDMHLLQPILEHVEQNDLLKEPAIAVYYYAYKALADRANEHYLDELLTLIIEKGQVFPLNELRELYLLAINYCVNRLNAGMDPFARKAFNLYRSGFEQEVLLENGLVSRMSFGNAVSIALKIREFIWAESFIQQFQDKLEEKYRESMVNFNLSRLYFEKGDYDKAQQLLSKFEYDDMVLNLVAKTMLLKIYYENDEYGPFESLLESMRIYLQRKDAIAPNYRIVYKNLFSIMRKLIQMNPYSKAQREKFRELVLNTNPLTEREWLLKQIQN